MDICLYCFPTVWGTAGLKSRDNKLSRLFLPGTDFSDFPKMISGDDLSPFLADLVKAVQNYFQGQRIEFIPRFDEPGLKEIFLKVKTFLRPSNPIAIQIFEVDIDTQGLSPFACRVLAATAAVPYGQTISYGLLSQLACGDTKHSRAVGQVLKNNPFPLVIPCHRIVGRSGLGGFSGANGVLTKLRMLALEEESLSLTPDADCGKR